MKPFLTLLLLLCSPLAGSLAAGRSTFQQLCAFNAGWQTQASYCPEALPAFESNLEADWIALHLQLVEQALRRRTTAGLTPARQAARRRSLDELRRYRLARAFPKNETVPGYRPVFIDRHDNFCAVGHLIKASGNEWLSRRIAAAGNLDYVKDMHYPELAAWASVNGFTTDELAWIQPAYGYAYAAKPVGRGTDGVVHELTVSPDGERLYVGGLFDTVDGSIAARNIAYLTKVDTTYTWHSMGLGTNGPVKAIAVHRDTVFIAGDFDTADGHFVNNVAFWDGSGWQDAGCLYGTVSDLVSFGGRLYAAGDFDVCAALSEVNFAHWTGAGWQQHPGLEGRVNTMEAVGTELLLGGAFDYLGQTANSIRFDPATGTFTPYSNLIKNEVLDIGVFRDSIYASCLHSSATDTVMLKVYRNGSWQDAARQPGYGAVSTSHPVALHTLCDAGNELFIGGSFAYMALVGSPQLNCANLYPLNWGGMAAEWFATDSSIYKFMMYKGELLLGGAFGGPNMEGIAQRVRTVPVSLPAYGAPGPLRVHPNPVAGNGLLCIESPLALRELRLLDALGRVLLTARPAAPAYQLPLGGLPAGSYHLELTDAAGAREVRPLSIR